MAKFDDLSTFETMGIARENRDGASVDFVANLDFIDDYLYRAMREILTEQGREQSGFYDYYERRVDILKQALSWYDRLLFGYFHATFDKRCRKIVHAGIGIGTLTVALAISGYLATGIERDRRRYAAATRLRMAVIREWPEAAECYSLVEGAYPDALAGSSWVSPRTILLFTNCGAGWSDQMTSEIIATFPRYGDVIFDARLLGRVRETGDREILLSEIRGHGIALEPVPGMPSNSFYYHGRPHLGSITLSRSG